VGIRRANAGCQADQVRELVGDRVEPRAVLPRVALVGVCLRDFERPVPAT
jgi:hypothetical protein